MSQYARRAAGRDVLFAAGLFGLVLWLLLPAVKTTPFHRDEARWVHRVYLLREWRDPFGPRWQDEGYPRGTRSLDERVRMRSQPPFASYVFGLGLLLQGRDLTTNGFWVMDRDDAWNAGRGNLPDSGDLRAARRTNVVIAALTVVAVYFIGKRLTNRVGGLAGASALALHPLLPDTATRAWSDPLLMLLVAWAVVAAYRLADRPTWPRAVGLGLLIGLGGATKLSPLLLAMPIGGLGVLLLARRSLGGGHGVHGRQERLGWMLATAPLIAWATFVAVYPYLWTAPIEQTRRLFQFRADSFRIQAAAFPQAAVPDLTDALRRVGQELGARFSTSERIIAAFDSPALTRFGERWELGDLDLAVATIGILLWVALVMRSGPRGGPTLAAIVLGGQVAITIGAMRVEYARYLLPVLLAVAVGIELVAGHAWIAIRYRWVRQREAWRTDRSRCGRRKEERADGGVADGACGRSGGRRHRRAAVLPRGVDGGSERAAAGATGIPARSDDGL